MSYAITLRVCSQVTVCGDTQKILLNKRGSGTSKDITSVLSVIFKQIK